MADNENTEAVEPGTPAAVESEGIATPELPAVTAQEAKVVDNEGAEPFVVEPEVNVEQVDAMVVQPREGDSDTVNVHEVSVATDRVITDPSSPLAVQIPPEGRGDGTLPIHALGNGTVEDYFKKNASESSDDE